MAYYSHQNAGKPLAAGILAVASAAAVLLAANRARSRGPAVPPGDAPPNAFRHTRGKTIVGRSVTINRPRRELYDFWRNLSNLPTFMENVKTIEVRDLTHSHWVVRGPGNTDIAFDATITEDKPGELIAWRSAKDAQIRHSGCIVFRDAPNGRGTEVEIEMSYDPPGGRIGQLAAKLFQREPNIQARRELKRFKQLMETGEISISQPLGQAGS